MEPITRTFETSTGKTKTVVLMRGDIAKVPADALMTAINSGGLWFGGIDGVIGRTCGNQFHAQAAAKMPLQDRQAIVATAKQLHSAKFTDVIFVVDDLQVPLNQIIQAGLNAANKSGYKTISLPAIRTGVMLGKVEPDAEQAAIQLFRGMEQHFSNFPDSTVEKLIFVIYEAGPVLLHMENTAKRISPTSQDPGVIS